MGFLVFGLLGLWIEGPCGGLSPARVPALHLRLLLYKMGVFAFGPWVVGYEEMDAVWYWGVIVKQEYPQRIWLWIFKHRLAKLLKASRHRLAWIGYDSVIDFETVNIGLVLEIPAERVSGGIGKEAKES